jgi:hypothetical protein
MAGRGNGQQLTVEALAEAKQLPCQYLRQLGLRDLAGGGVGIPYYGPTGEEIAVKRRTALKATEGSYWPKQPLAAYGQERLDAAMKASFLILVEGESDCWTVWYHGLPALGIPGANAVKTLQYEHVEVVEGIYVLREPDRGGEIFVAGIRDRLPALGFSGKLFELRMPDGIKDPADLHVADPERFKATLEEAILAATPLELPRPAGRNGRGPRSSDADVAGQGAYDRPVITITTDEHLVNDQAIVALTSDKNLYQRGGMMVRFLTDEPVATGGIRWSMGPRIEPLPRELLRERLAAAAYWVVEKRGEIVPARPPDWCIGAVHVRGQFPGIRPLYAVVDHPVLRQDGTILLSPGYDASTQLYLASDKPIRVPDRPTLADAHAATRILLDVVQDFPFASDAHRTAWLAALLTPLARFAFEGPAPLFLVDSNVRGSGKGLLLDCTCTIITGKRFTIATYSDDLEELRKRFLSLAIAGERLVLFDNLEGRFGNAVLDAALTATSWEDRLLGVNRMIRAPLLVTWFATGNNVAVHADTARRICHVRLESPHEHPELRRDFNHPELLKHVGDRRDELLVAAFAILSAYCVAGKPRQDLSAWGSFQGLSDLVRSAVVWCKLPDPATTRMQLQERSDVTKRYMDKKATEPAPAHILDLNESIEAMVGRLDAKGLGYKLRSHRRRNFNGKYLDVPSTSKRAARWAVFHAHEFSTGQSHPHHPHHPHRGEHGEDGENVSLSQNSGDGNDGHSNAYEPPEDRA